MERLSPRANGACGIRRGSAAGGGRRRRSDPAARCSMRPSSSSGRRRDLAMRDGVVPPCQAMTTVPPGRTTRCSSPTAASRSGQIATLFTETTRSTLASGRPVRSAVPRSSRTRPVRTAFRLCRAGLVAHLRGRVDATDARRVGAFGEKPDETARSVADLEDVVPGLDPEDADHVVLLVRPQHEPARRSGRASRSGRANGLLVEGSRIPGRVRGAMPPRWHFKPG